MGRGAAPGTSGVDQRALGLGHGPGLGRGGPAGDGAVGVVFDAGDLGGDAEADAGAAHLREGNGGAAAIGFVAEVGFALAEVLEGPREVAVPLDGVHGEVEVGVEEEHGRRIGQRWRFWVQKRGPRIQGANSSSPMPRSSDLVRLPAATATISSKMRRPTSSTVSVPSRMVPALRSMSSFIQS